ncbi:MAG: nucleotidyltransferase [Verrucomicrobia bacterium]|nr:nucleotidyltransferase [Verrucomicrobiota bacterium]
MKPTLLILAAGIGSRYGGLKQLDPVGPSGEIVIDYSIFDALRAGFGKVVFVIRRDIEKDFRDMIGGKFEDRTEVAYAFQDLDALPPGFTVPPERSKPWGTAHAVLVAEKHVPGPFAVINADDFYGRAAYRILAGFLAEKHNESPPEYAMVGYSLRNTLSPFGSVARGVCSADEHGFLRSVDEITDIIPDGDDAGHTDADGRPARLAGDTVVSMNMWGFTPSLFEYLSAGFEEFLREKGSEAKSEFFLPMLVDQLITSGKALTRMLKTDSAWFGVTYKEDKPLVVRRIAELVAAGEYPPSLWRST